MNRQQRRLLAKSGQKPKPEGEVGAQVDACIQAAIQCLSANQLDLSIYYCEHALKIDPENVDAQLYLGNALFNHGQYDRAENVLGVLYKSQQRVRDAGLLLCQLYIKKGKMDAAKRIGLAVSKDFPRDPLILRALSIALYQLGEYREYIEVAKSYLSLSNSDTDAKIELSSAYTKVDQAFDAIDLIKTFISDNLHNESIVDVYCNLLMNYKLYDDFFIFMNKLKSLNTYNINSRILMLELKGYFEKKNTIEMSKCLDYVIEKDVNDTNYFITGIRSLVGLENFAFALKYIRYYRAHYGRDSEISYYFGLLLFKRSKYKTSIRVTRKLHDMVPSDERFLDLLILSNLEVDQRDEARQLYESFSGTSKYKDHYADLILSFTHPAEGFLKSRLYFEEKLAEFQSIGIQDALFNPINYSQYMFWLHSNENVKAIDILNETLHFTSKMNELAPSHRVTYKKKDKIRVGYVSGDLRAHVVAFYIDPVIKFHNRNDFEVYCYYNYPEEDEVSSHLKGLSNKWYNINDMTDNQVIDLIRKDEIDILVDLSGHTAKNRMYVFANKPATIQMTWIGYFNTTGINNIDYIISDDYLIPATSEHLYTETPLRLSIGSAAQSLPAYDIPITPPPALESGVVSFGCYASIRKYNDLAIELWSKVLHKVPNSKLLLKAREFDEGRLREKYLRKFASNGINASRIQISGSQPHREYLEEYRKVDILLGTFPYNTATTCLDGLWMGVPEVSLQGEMLVSRISGCYHHKLGLDDFIANTPEEFVEKAVDWANRLDELSEIRRTLRGRVETCPMMDPAAFTKCYEDALRDVWNRWRVNARGAGRG